MRLTHRMIYGVAISTLAIALGVTTAVRARGDSRPAPADVTFAQTVSDLMVNELVAALFQEFKETTPDNIEHGKQAISLIFNDLNRHMRLVGTFRPLLGGSNDRPTGEFERTALQLALTGQPYAATEGNDNWFYVDRFLSVTRSTRRAFHKFHAAVLQHKQPRSVGGWWLPSIKSGKTSSNRRGRLGRRRPEET